MSNQAMSASTQGAAARQGGKESGGKDEAAQQSVAPGYLAPYDRNERYAVPDIYIVGFNPGHTIAKHFAFIGHEFPVTELDGIGYFATMDKKLLDAIRRDPGVECVEDNCYGERDG